MHRWGDTEVDGHGVYNAAAYIGEGLRRWGRVDVSQYKEKWGEVRVYLSFGWTDLIQNTCYPGYAYLQYPRALWPLSKTLSMLLCPALNLVVVPYQRRLYRHYYKRAMQKWPHLRAEILGGADYPELLGGL